MFVNNRFLLGHFSDRKKTGRFKRKPQHALGLSFNRLIIKKNVMKSRSIVSCFVLLALPRHYL